MPTSKPPGHAWEFRARFRARAFGWKGSKLAAERLKQALNEIKAVARHSPIAAAEGAVLLLERISPAFEEIDSSSGAIGTAVYNAIDALVPLIGDAEAPDEVRERWLIRLFEALQADQVPYIEHLGDRWGELCRTPVVASEWADQPALRFRACEAVLLAAGRREEAYGLALVANGSTSRLTTFRNIHKKYPEYQPAFLLKDLIRRTRRVAGWWAWWA